ncbi:MAG: type II toxin-antitoxin system VapC family toxin [Candidatus Woesearchaeota archaeon]
MNKRFYVDTCIWMDCFENRKDKHKNIGELAYLLLSKIMRYDDIIIVSDFILRELEIYYSNLQIIGLFSPFYKILDIVIVSKNQLIESNELSMIKFVPPGDAVHAIVARDSGAILVTRDRHFNRLKGVCEVLKPEEII